MNRYLLTATAFSLLLTWKATAQPVDYNKIIPPASAVDLNFSERLVQLAWENYAVNRAFDIDVLSAEKSIKLAKLAWWELLSMQLNINARTIETFGDFSLPDQNENQFFPWYNVGINISPSKFFTNPAKVQMAELQYQLSLEALNAQKLRLRAETLTRYELYKHNLEVVKAVSENYELANSTFILLREQFNKGEATFNDFNSATQARINALTGKFGAEMQFNIAKIALEELIGMKLEEVTR